jgi:GNAT superfamily N-acetyltransferase
MDLSIRPVSDENDLKQFVMFPWTCYRGDPYWVAPLVKERSARLNRKFNPFWLSRVSSKWIAWRGSQPVGTILAAAPTRAERGSFGTFGFFECLDDPSAASALLECACDWLKDRGLKKICGPYNPGPMDEPGILVDGFETRPAIMMGHNPPLYQSLVESAGFTKQEDMIARLASLPRNIKNAVEIMPPRLAEVAARAGQRPDLLIRRFNSRAYDSEVQTAWTIYNTALAPVSGFTPIPWREFYAMAQGFRPFLDPNLALVAEVDGDPVGFVLLLPDLNEALQAANGGLGPVSMLRFMWRRLRLTRVSFKILVILPEFQGRGIEAVLINRAAQAVVRRGYREIDLSLTGEENVKSTLFQERLGMDIYRRYRIYQKRL